MNEADLDLVEVCGLCRFPIGKYSKRIRCGYCHAVFICSECGTESGYHKYECSKANLSCL